MAKATMTDTSDLVINLTPNPYILDGKIWVWAWENAGLFQRRTYDPRKTILIVPEERYETMSKPKWEFKRVLTN